VKEKKDFQGARHFIKVLKTSKMHQILDQG